MAMPAAAGVEQGPLAIIAGGGAIPLAVADAVERSGRRVVLFPVRGWADPAAVVRYPHHWIAVAQAGRFQRLAKQEGCRDVVFIGTAVRPPLSSFRIDWGTLRLLPAVARAYRGGDDHLLSGVVRLFEEKGGFRIVGAHEVAPDILMPEGPIGSLSPSERDRSDIARALALLEATGPFDMGQAAVVADNHVLAVEACWSRRRSRSRTAASIFRQSGRAPSRRRRARGLAELLPLRAAPLWPSPL
jgi:hypothetical protein